MLKWTKYPRERQTVTEGDSSPDQSKDKPEPRDVPTHQSAAGNLVQGVGSAGNSTCEKRKETRNRNTRVKDRAKSTVVSSYLQLDIGEQFNLHLLRVCDQQTTIKLLSECTARNRDRPLHPRALSASAGDVRESTPAFASGLLVASQPRIDLTESENFKKNLSGTGRGSSSHKDLTEESPVSTLKNPKGKSQGATTHKNPTQENQTLGTPVPVPRFLDSSNSFRECHNLAPSPRKSKMASELPDLTAQSSPEGQSKDEILGPELEWDETDLTLSQVAEKDDFPCICCYEEVGKETDGRWEFLSAGLKVYQRQPVLFYSHTKKKQARARTIHKDQRGAYYELGQTMLIPDDYQGWFELVPSDFSRASCFTSIADVAKAMPARFFTRSNVRGIKVEEEGEQQKFLERKVPAGSVLLTKGTFTAKWKTRAETGLFKKKMKEWEFQEVTYLKCIDKDQSELLVPLTHKGKFNTIYDSAGGRMTQNAVYSMKDILSEMSLPVKVRLLFGKAPVVPCIFTGMLVIREVCMDDMIVGSTMLNARNVLFEIPINAPVKLRYHSTDEPFEEMSTYKDAKKLCRKYAHLYSTMIKLSPDLDTDQKVIQHVPTDPSVMREADEALRALDLITDISLTDEPKDHLLDTDSASGESDTSIMPKGGASLAELTEYKSRESQTHV